ncbi:MAG TPA: hypothetical protein VJH92_04715 [Candidatus Nanoarchaeia archaeon]|nr:hypothetical protein [Candidatus Nanoarchaeia archaeon]
MVNENGYKIKIDFFLLMLVEVALLFVMLSFLDPFVAGGVGGNVTVNTSLTVGNVSPEVLNVSLLNGSTTLTLVANSTVTVDCAAVVRDFNGNSTISVVRGEFFDNTYSSLGNTSDNNFHYKNNSCTVNLSFGSWNGVVDDDYMALANCTYPVYYYANPGNWNCTIVVNDTSDLNATGWDNITISDLLALGVPGTINYGTVNATYVSDENISNVTNYGNVKINLSLYGYGYTANDNNSMNCTLGSNKNISINYEKYNLTASTSGSQTLTQFEANYTNLSIAATVKTFGLDYRRNDTAVGYDDTNSTYWRIYVPTGVAGTCEGRIVFGATVATGS